jgi:microcin C transport system ATP-binding protein
MIFQEPMTALNPLFTMGEQIAEVLQLKQGLDRARSAAGRGRTAGEHRHPGAAARGPPSRTSSPAASASAP